MIADHAQIEVLLSEQGFSEAFGFE